MFLDDTSSEKIKNNFIVSFADTFNCNNICDNVQTTTTKNEELKRKIKTLNQKIRRRDIKIDNMSNLLKSLQRKKVLLMKIPKI